MKARIGPRTATKAQVDRELWATARMVDSCAAQVLMLGEDDFVSEDEHDELEDLGQALRRVSADIYARTGDKRWAKP